MQPGKKTKNKKNKNKNKNKQTNKTKTEGVTVDLQKSHEKSAAKRSNMADTGEVETKDEDTSSSEQNKPDLHEIKQVKTA